MSPMLASTTINYYVSKILFCIMYSNCCWKENHILNYQYL